MPIDHVRFEALANLHLNLDRFVVNHAFTNVHKIEFHTCYELG